MHTLISYIKATDAFKSFCSDSTANVFAEGLDGFPLFVYALMCARQSGRRIWVICPTEESARLLYSDAALACQMLSVSDDTALLCSSSRGIYDTFKDNTKDYEQLRTLGAINEENKRVIVTNIRAFCCPVVPRSGIESKTIKVKVGDTLDTMAVAGILAEGSYYRSDKTAMPGEFTVRGEVMDIFPYGAALPVRIFLDWDKVERICTFEPLGQSLQRTMGHIEIQSVSKDGGFETSYGAITTYLRGDDYFIFCGDKRLASSYESLCAEAKASYRTAWQENHNAELPDKVLLDFDTFIHSQKGSLTVIDITGQNNDSFRFGISGPRSYFGNFTFLENDLGGLEYDHWKIEVYSSSKIQRERLEVMLAEHHSVKVLPGEISSGFSIPAEHFIAINESEIFGRKRQVVKTLQHTKTSVLDSFTELAEGDFVVHVNYGIGVFLKIDRVRERDYIKIQFADREILYVPIEQANLIQRYIGSAGESPHLDKLGTSSWETKKAKARQSAEKLAGELVELYARRQSSRGHAFDRDGEWQTRFEAMFEYEETEDQLTCINDIKDDMESNRVMDRLICGDVGYGKTEVAFRAVFKAVMSGTQVAFLAPTTILAEQHYRNFRERLHDFPVKCGLLSRMVSAKDRKEILSHLEDGSIEVIFGTHRIIQNDVKFSNLGLLVVDEEQRFGVKDKERIKQLKANIDCLSLSATPIPRTLYMSLLKIRDMSLLTTPPIQRKPIRTIVDSFDIDTVITAIRFEIDRGGQVFYLHNRIDTLEAVSGLLREKMPGVTIESAHGQMKGDALEDTMRRFLYRGIQVLVSTTIIENGIDIPNVNTIIIDRADLYGVSQLYQLRGRVGRSDVEGWAYLLYPDGHSLREDAIKRLQIISEHTELGSGFKVAMKDMEMRGAGNILGKEQSGFMSVVGLDMYIRLLDEAVSKLQNNGERPEPEVFLDLDYSGFIPDSYISDATLKFEVYKKISGIKTEEELEKLTAELSDRFGPVPDDVSNLLYICDLRIVCRRLDIFHLKERGGIVTAELSKVVAMPVDRVIQMMKTSGGSFWYDQRHPDCLFMKTDAISLKDKALFILEKLQRLIV